MIIKTIEIKNFRSIKNARLDCENLTVIVGRNGAGKSSFLKAIEVFYDTAAPITEEDFFNREIGSPIEICVTYGNLRKEEKEEFSPYLKDEKLTVTKRISSEDGKFYQRYYAASLQIKQFAEIRAISTKRQRIEKWNALVESGQLPALDKKVKNADEIEKNMEEYESAHPEMMELVEKEEQFFGPKNIGGGKLDKFTKYVLVPAVKDATDEISGKKGAIYQILDMIVLRKINAREDIKKFKLEFEEKVKKLYSSENLRELPELGESISQTLEKFAPGSKLKLGWSEVKIPEIQLPAARATVTEDRFEGEITHKGHGLQRALIVTLLQHLAVTHRGGITEEATEKESPDSSEPKINEKSIIPDLILAIEEPELYLHPSRCRYLSNLLLNLSESPEGAVGVNNQIIYTTHSPYFVDLNRFDQIRLIKKVSDYNSAIPYSTVTQFSLKEAAKEMANICNKDPACFTRDSFKARAVSVMNIVVNEGFFADVVVVVEGVSEASLLWKLQEILNKDWSKLGIAVVPADGKNNIDRPVVIFRGFSIPNYFIFDADFHLIGSGRKEEEAKNRNHRYLRLAGAQRTEDFPNTQVHESWAVFKENMEAILKEALGNETFNSIREQVASELGYDEASKILKNIEGISRFIELVYENNHRIPVLEEIIENITRLGKSIEINSGN